MVWGSRSSSGNVRVEVIAIAVSVNEELMDVFSRQKRSEVMSRIRGKDNVSTERRMAALLRSRGIAGWRFRPVDIFGRPDIYFPHLRLAIFLDGCFWHACPKCFQMPAQNRSFWVVKVRENLKRDRQVNRSLRGEGLKVIRLWEHDLERGTSRLAGLLEMLQPKTG